MQGEIKRFASHPGFGAIWIYGLVRKIYSSISYNGLEGERISSELRQQTRFIITFLHVMEEREREKNSTVIKNNEETKKNSRKSSIPQSAYLGK